jgi:uncharacterized RDD family membrane protein YckC/DNA-binding transcriptional ArsR family regulator
MSVDQESVSKILSVLSHKIRREILLILHEKGDTSFTELLNTLKIDTGKLSFHIRSLSPFIEQSENGKYKLSRAGEDSIRVIKDVESWSEMSDVTHKTTQLLVASFKRRTYAFLIDYGIMFALAIPILLPTLLEISGNFIIIPINLVFVALAFVWVYSTILEGFSGQTVGKRVIGLIAIKASGKKIDYEHAAVRNFGKILLPFDLLFGYMLKDPRYLRYFDKFAGTTVIDLRRRAAITQSTDNQVTSQTPETEVK